MKRLKNLLKELTTKGDNTIENWINENYDCTGLKISKNPNRDGLYEVTARDVTVKNKNITSLTNGMFEWKEVNDFNCSECTLLTSLEGAPENIEGDFSCYKCTSLTSLKGAPEKVGGYFYCYMCTVLKSLKGAPKKVGGSFSCLYCTKLQSLDGAPKEVIGNFYCQGCKIQFTEDDIRKVSDVKGKMHC